MAIVYGTGRQLNKATALANTPRPFTTQQIGVDNSLLPGYRAMVGTNKNRGAASVRP